MFFLDFYKVLLNGILAQKRFHVNISSKTQDMMENIAEDTVEAYLLSKKVSLMVQKLYLLYFI